MGSVIRAVGTYLPERELTNNYLERILAASGQETSNDWIVQRTGIHKRRIARTDETVEMMGVNAVIDAFRSIPSGGPLDYIILASNTHEQDVPNTGSGIVEGLSSHGLVTPETVGITLVGGCGAINIALEIGDGLAQSGRYKRVGVIGSEKLSRITDYSDRSMCILFGDAASAYILEPNEDKGSGFVGHYSKGTRVNAEGVPARQFIRDVVRERVTFEEAERALERGDVPRKEVGRILEMDGKEVFEYALSELKDLLEKLKDNKTLNSRKIGFDEIDAIAVHLANYRILHAVDKKHPGFLEKCAINPEVFCNTSTASQGRRVKQYIQDPHSRGKHLLMVGFGAGLILGANLYRHPNS